MIRKSIRYLLLVMGCLTLGSVFAADKGGDKHGDMHHAHVKAQSSATTGDVSIEGHKLGYKAVAGTLILHEDDAGKKEPMASIFYVAYFKTGVDSAKRPITFLYNGGPGSSTVWLHMGAFGPRRVVTKDNTHTPAAPYKLINNDFSLLDASDLVFIDAPGTGFSRLLASDKDPAKRKALMKKRGKQFFGVDQDAHAFARFISQFLSKYGRWNSPKYLFGESYGTTRSAVLSNILQSDDNIDLNGVILLSQVLSFDDLVDFPSKVKPGNDMAYALALPSFAATAFYHHKLPNPPADMKTLLDQVEHFALNDYLQALVAGSTLDPARKHAIAQKLHEYTGLPVAYLEKANLRVDGGKFEKNLQSDSDMTTGRLDSRFSGPSMDPLSEEAEYDPQSAAIASAYVSVFNDYVRKQLKFGDGMTYKPEINLWGQGWDWKHQPPGAQGKWPFSTNVMPDLAAAMKYNPNLKVMLNSGYFDLATTFFTAVYEMHHLPMPARLQSNIEYKFYDSGHMVYAHEPSLKKLHDNVAAFIEKTDNLH